MIGGGRMLVDNARTAYVIKHQREMKKLVSCKSVVIFLLCYRVLTWLGEYNHFGTNKITNKTAHQLVGFGEMLCHSH